MWVCGYGAIWECGGSQVGSRYDIICGVMTTILTEEEEAAWAGLLEEAEASLGDAELESYRKRCKKVREKKLFTEWDRRGIKKFLLEYAKLENGFVKCVKLCEMSKLAIVTACSQIPEMHLVYSFVSDKRKKLMAMENEEILAKARRGLEKLVAEPECGINVKAVTFAMERLDRETFGVSKDAGGVGGVTVNYNIPNLNVALIMSPNEIAARGIGGKAIGNDSMGEVIGVEAEVKKVEVKRDEV